MCDKSETAQMDEVIHLIVAANRLLRERGEDVAHAAGQTHARRMVLQSAERGRSIADIARDLGLTRQGVQRIGNDLVDDGLATYKPNPRHQRAKLLLPTGDGQRALKEIHNAHDQWISKLSYDTAGIDLEALTVALNRVLEALDAPRTR